MENEQYVLVYYSKNSFNCYGIYDNYATAVGDAYLMAHESEKDEISPGRLHEVHLSNYIAFMVDKDDDYEELYAVLLNERRSE